MAKTRRKKKPQPTKGTHGGVRPGAGRPKKIDGGMKLGIYLRCSAEQKAALVSYVEDLSTKRIVKGLPKVELSTWIRELALKHSGNDHLGAAAAARRAAEAAASIV